MKIFLSCSGERSVKCANAFCRWLKATLQGTNPYIFTSNPSGSQWLAEINKALSESQFGLVFLTRESVNAPWVHFESGVLAGSLKNAVCPILLGLEIGDVGPPLNSFIMRKFVRHDMKRLVEDLNERLIDGNRLSESMLEDIFESQFDRLEIEIQKVMAQELTERIPPNREIKDILNEILDVVRDSRTNQDGIQLGVNDLRQYRGIWPDRVSERMAQSERRKTVTSSNPT